MFLRMMKKLIRRFRLNDLFIIVFGRFYHEYVHDDYEESFNELNTFSENPNSSCIRKNQVAESPVYDVQIIIPIYNSEKYIEECIESVLSQKTKYAYKIVLVDDGSKDSSRQIISAFKADNVEIIVQENNGAAVARNKGLMSIDSRYVFFLDSDDLMPENTIEKLISFADINKADYVEGSLYRLTNDVITTRKKHKRNRKISSVTEYNGLICGGLFSSRIFENVIFPEHTLYEDTNLGFILCPLISNGYQIEDYTYVYRDNPTSVTYADAGKKRNVETYWVTRKLIEDYYALGLSNNDDLYRMFLSQVICNNRRLRTQPENIQKCVFNLTCMLAEKIELKGFQENCHSILKKAILDHDYGIYKLYCHTR